MIIDAHAHVVLPVTRQLQAMDEAGIDKTLLMQTQNHPEQATTLAEFTAEWQILQDILAGRRNALDARRAAAREQDDSLSACPERFLAWGSVPVGLPEDETAAWVQDLVVNRQCIGIGEVVHAPGQAALVEPLLRAAADHGGLPVFVHGISPTTWQDLAQTQAIADRYPQVPLIIGAHGGFSWVEVVAMIRETPRTYLDVSSTFSVFQLSIAAAEIPGRLVFGSNSPFGDPLLTRHTVERIISSDSLRSAVLGGTMAELLGW